MDEMWRTPRTKSLIPRSSASFPRSMNTKDHPLTPRYTRDMISGLEIFLPPAQEAACGRGASPKPTRKQTSPSRRGLPLLAPAVPLILGNPTLAKPLWERPRPPRQHPAPAAGARPLLRPSVLLRVHVHVGERPREPAQRMLVRASWPHAPARLGFRAAGTSDCCTPTFCVSRSSIADCAGCAGSRPSAGCLRGRPPLLLAWPGPSTLAFLRFGMLTLNLELGMV